MVWSRLAVSAASMTCSSDAFACLVTTSSRCGGSHASTRPVPSHPLAKKCARNSPPRRRSPCTSPSQPARRRGSVSADQRSSIWVSKRSSMRTTPLPSADRRLPRIRSPPPALPVIRCSFLSVFLRPPRSGGTPPSGGQVPALLALRPRDGGGALEDQLVRLV